MVKMFYNIRRNPCNVLIDTDLADHPFKGVTMPGIGESPEMGLKTALKNISTFLNTFK